MISLLLSLSFAKAVDSLFKQFSFHFLREADSVAAVLNVDRELALKLVFVEKLFEADSGAFFVYVNNSRRGLFFSPISSVDSLGKKVLKRDCDEISPIAVAALRALGVNAVVGFFTYHSLPVVKLSDSEAVAVEVSFPYVPLYRTRWEFYKGYFYNKGAYEGMLKIDKRYTEVFPVMLNREVKRILKKRVDFPTIRKRVKEFIYRKKK